MTHKPTDKTRELARNLAGYGTPQDSIARIIKISETTLRKHYYDELQMGMAQANAMVGESLYKQATSGNTAAAIFWLKARCGWREKQEVEHTGQVSMIVTGVPRPQDDSSKN